MPQALYSQSFASTHKILHNNYHLDILVHTMKNLFGPPRTHTFPPNIGYTQAAGILFAPEGSLSPLKDP